MASPTDHDAFIDSLVDDALKETEEIETDQDKWIERQMLRWHDLERDDTWIRIRIETAQATRSLNRLMISKGLSEAQRRQALRAIFADISTTIQGRKQQSIQQNMLQDVIHQMSKHIAAIAFGMYPSIAEDQFMTCVEEIIQHEGKVTLSQLSQSARRTLYALISTEYKRLGGTITVSAYAYKKQRKHHPMPK
jgi:hypothetical protein